MLPISYDFTSFVLPAVLVRTYDIGCTQLFCFQGAAGERYAEQLKDSSANSGPIAARRSASFSLEFGGVGLHLALA